MAPGRPQDPSLRPHVLTVATRLLAEERMAGWNTDRVVAITGVSKGSLYRRWSSLDELLADVIRGLGVRAVDFGDGPGEDRADVFRLLAAATTGTAALAEAAVLSEIGTDDLLRQAYAHGPVVRFFTAADQCRQRAQARGEVWPATLMPILVGWSSLMYRVATTGQQPNLTLLEDTVDGVVLPSLRIFAAASAARA